MTGYQPQTTGSSTTGPSRVPVTSLEQLASNYAASMTSRGIPFDSLTPLVYAIQYAMSQSGYIGPRDLHGTTKRKRKSPPEPDIKRFSSFLDDKVIIDYDRLMAWENRDVVRELLPYIEQVRLYSGRRPHGKNFSDLTTEEEVGYIMNQVRRGLVREKTRIRPVIAALVDRHYRHLMTHHGDRRRRGGRKLA